MIDKKKAKLNPQKQWMKFIAVLVLYLLFLLWVKSWWGLLVVPFIYDVYITKKIRWQWWKDAEGPVRWVMSWVDALVFALVAVYFINLFFFQNFVIPSSSLEKSLLTGDYLFVSKVSYGPRIPQTPLTMPLTQHTLPVFECKSYVEWPHWDYRRVKGLGKVQLNDIVVFNYPAGDTICTKPQYETYYYDIVYSLGWDAYSKGEMGEPINLTQMTTLEQRQFFDRLYAAGKKALAERASDFGGIDTRPTDRRENYVKRCVGLPGQTLQVKDHIVYLDGKRNKEPDNVQYSYHVTLKASLPEELIRELGISMEDLTSLNQNGYMPLTNRAVKVLRSRKDLVESIEYNDEENQGEVFPRNAYTGWTRDNYGPLWIPKKGAAWKVNLKELPMYERCIRNYEGNDLKVTADGRILINGKEMKEYVFKLDYYWMEGDNRHNSADSRYWGFVPEDHIVGKPIFIWWSSDPDRSGFAGVRWNRLYKWVDGIK